MESDKSSERGLAEVCKYMLSYIDSMALRCAVELHIPDIINNSPGGGPISLTQIASEISGDSSPNTTVLGRVMRLLVRRNIFSASGSSEPILYGLTASSRWLVTSHDTSSSSGQLSLVPLFQLASHPLAMALWHHLPDCVRSGETVFGRESGTQIWDFAEDNPEYAKMFNDGMECSSRITMRAVLADYSGFRVLRTVVDVGGGTGVALSEIVKSHPNVCGINFDLPRVIATAPAYPRVSHVAGDMFHGVPKADAVFMKWILHDWSDEDCKKILKNCRQAIPENGKVIIVEVVLDPEGHGPFDDTALVLDLAMVSHTTGRERTEKEWQNLLTEGGFPCYKIFKISSLQSIIEAYPVSIAASL